MIEAEVVGYRGRIVKLTGDGILAEFASAVDAVECTVAIQRAMYDRNADVPEDRRIEFRMGINLADFIVDQGYIFGDGVNLAARIESMARPGGVAVSATVRDNVLSLLDLAFGDTGYHDLKNVSRPIRIFGVCLDGAADASAARDLAGGAARPLPLPLPLPDKPSIAVLPFVNVSADRSRTISPTASRRTSRPTCRRFRPCSWSVATRCSHTRDGRQPRIPVTPGCWSLRIDLARPRSIVTSAAWTGEVLGLNVVRRA